MAKIKLKLSGSQWQTVQLLKARGVEVISNLKLIVYSGVYALSSNGHIKGNHNFLIKLFCFKNEIRIENIMNFSPLNRSLLWNLSRVRQAHSFCLERYEDTMVAQFADQIQHHSMQLILN